MVVAKIASNCSFVAIGNVPDRFIHSQGCGCVIPKNVQGASVLCIGPYRRT